jgi:hypothetical protein
VVDAGDALGMGRAKLGAEGVVAEAEEAEHAEGTSVEGDEDARDEDDEEEAGGMEEEAYDGEETDLAEETDIDREEESESAARVDSLSLRYSASSAHGCASDRVSFWSWLRLKRRVFFTATGTSMTD